MDIKKEILSAYKFRHACKTFDPTKKIASDDFNFILETGRLSPSSFGFEPWKFLIIQNKELREKLKEFAWGAQGQLETSSHFLILLARKAIDMDPKSEYIKNLSSKVHKLPKEVVELRTNYYAAFQKNDFDLSDDRKLFDWATKQVYLPLANMMTAAAQIGIDSCPIEGFDRVKLETFLHHENIIDTNHFGVAVMVAFGYRVDDSEIKEKTRQDLTDIVEWIK